MGIKNFFKTKAEDISEEINEKKEAVGSAVQQGVSKTKRFLKRLIIILIIVSVLSGIGYLLYANYNYSKGTRTGQLIKISERGWVFKTYEGQMNQGDGTHIWEFSVTDEDVFKTLQDFEGKKVKLTYKQIIQPMPWQGDTEYFIIKVEPAKTP